MSAKKPQKQRLSGNVIAQHLGLEGYNDRTHNLVQRFWEERIARESARRANARIETKFSELVQDLELSEAERKIVGQFISLKCEANFDAGLQIGLVAANWQNAEHQ